MNKTIQTVRLGADPEVKTGSNGNKIVSFSGAVKKSYTKEGESDTAWFRYTAFGKTAEHIANYLKKGSFVLITSEVAPNDYTKDGVKHYGVNFIVQNVEFLEKRNAEGGAPAQPQAQASQPVEAPASAPVADDDAELPFNVDAFDF